MPDRDQALALAESFGHNLRRVRRREDLSQEKLAKRAGLHRTEIGLLEKGQRVCRIDTLIRLAGAMAIPPGNFSTASVGCRLRPPNLWQVLSRLLRNFCLAPV